MEPEQISRELVKLTVRLANLELLATMLAKMAMVWAMVVLLGGFVSSLNSWNFYCISALLLLEGIRVFFRSHELRLQETFLNLSRVQERRTEHLQCPEQSADMVIDVDIIPIVGSLMSVLPWCRNLPRHVLLKQLSVLVLAPTTWSNFFAVYNLDFSQRGIWGRPVNQKNLEAAVFIFYSLIVAETWLFTFWRVILDIRIRLRLLSYCKTGPFSFDITGFLHMLEKFLGAVYTSSLKGAQSHRNFIYYIAEELPGLSNFAEQRESLLLLKALCSPKAKVKAGIATRDFITSLFSLMTLKYPREIRQEAISLVADLAQDEEALETIRLVVSDEERVTVIIKALYPVMSRDVLVLLERLAGDGVEEGGAAQNMFQVKLEVAKHGFEFLTNALRSEDATKSMLARRTLLRLHWNWDYCFHDILELFNIFLVEGLLGAGEVLCYISEFPWHKEMLQKLLGDGDGERLQKLLEFVLDQRRGYYPMRILKNVCAGGNHHLGRTELRAILDKIWQEKLVEIVNMLPYLEDRNVLFLAMMLFTSVVDSVGVPAASFSQDTKERLIQKLLSTCNLILEEIGPQTIDQVMNSGAEAARQEPVTLRDGIRAVESPVECNELFLYTLVLFCSKLLEIDAASFHPLASGDKLDDYLRFIHIQ